MRTQPRPAGCCIAHYRAGAVGLGLEYKPAAGASSARHRDRHVRQAGRGQLEN